MRVPLAGPLLTVIVVLASVRASAAELSAFVEDRQLGVVLSDVQFPASLSKDLMSGLTNRLLIRITLEQLDQNQSARQRSAEIAIRYDLWDEVFTCATRLDSVAPEISTKRSVQDVVRWLERIRLPRLFDATGIGNTNGLIVRTELLLNPIDRERIENLRKWVAENSTRRSLDPAGALAASDASLANAVFNKIFEQYASGSDVAAVWQQRIATPRFTLEALSHDRR
jgi:hypothetical protein